MSRSKPLTMLVLGATIHSANRGVSALGLATLANLRRAFPEARLILANSGLATGLSLHVGTTPFEVETSWIVPSRSLRPRSGTAYLNLLRMLRPWVPDVLHRLLSTRTFEQLDQADVVLDISGGDSFADTYGQRLLWSQIVVKQLALAMGKPLVLLPQSLGPFASGQSSRAACRILRRSLLVASRDWPPALMLRSPLSLCR